MSEITLEVLQERIENLRRELLVGLDTQKQATQMALAASEKAVLKAETASEKRFESVNEFRATLQDQAAHLMPRAEVEALVKALRMDIARIEEVQNKSTGHAAGTAQLWGLIVAAVGMIVVVVGVVALVMR